MLHPRTPLRAALLLCAVAACLSVAPGARASAQLQLPEGFSHLLDLSSLPIEFPEIVTVSDPQYASNLSEDVGTTLARHIRVDAQIQGRRGSFALFLDGDVRIGLALDWAPPALNDASEMRLLATTTVEVVNLAYRVEPVLEQAGPCTDEGVPLLKFEVDAWGIPVKIALLSRLCGGMEGANEGTISGWVQSTCGVATPEGGSVPLPVCEFERSFTLQGEAKAHGDSELDLLCLRASAAVARMGASLFDASVEASCPYVGATMDPEGAGGEITFGARASVSVNCSAMLKMLGMQDQKREVLYVERVKF